MKAKSTQNERLTCRPEKKHRRPCILRLEIWILSWREWEATEGCHDQLAMGRHVLAPPQDD